MLRLSWRWARIAAQHLKAEVIVTGDKDLLDHAGLQPPAVSAGEAVDRLAPPQPD
jgi:hypothetical protein